MDTEILPAVDVLVKLQRFLNRHSAHGDNPVNVEIGCCDVIRHKNCFDQKFVPDFIGRVAFRILLIS